MAYVNILELVYPVGSIYISINGVSPAQSIGGTWEQITGKYLRADTVGKQTGGTDTYSYTYGLDWLDYYSNNIAWNQEDGSYYFGLWDEIQNKFVSGNRVELTAMDGKYNSALAKSSATSSNSYHRGITITIEKDLLPSYITVNMWIRTA